MEIESGYQALQVWNQEAMRSAPILLKIWLSIMALTLFGSILFVKKHQGARGVLFTTALGLLFTKYLAPQAGLTVYSGLVALTHVCLWPISLFFLYNDLRKTSYGIYKIWIYWAGGVIVVSLIFDIRDAFSYLSFILSL